MAVRNPDPGELRRQRQVGLAAIVVGVIALLLIGAVLFGGFFGPSASSSPTPSSVAATSGSPSGRPSGSPSAAPSATASRPSTSAPAPSTSAPSGQPTDLPSPTPSSSQAAFGDATARGRDVQPAGHRRPDRTRSNSAAHHLQRRGQGRHSRRSFGRDRRHRAHVPVPGRRLGRAARRILHRDRRGRPDGNAHCAGAVDHLAVR